MPVGRSSFGFFFIDFSSQGLAYSSEGKTYVGLGLQHVLTATGVDSSPSASPFADLLVFGLGEAVRPFGHGSLH